MADLAFDNLADITEQYDAFLIDQFGVMIDGQSAYPGAVEALAHIARQDKPAIVLSNSGKRAQPNCERVASFGFHRDHFRTVVTSGEIAFQSIRDSLGKSIKPDSKVMILAREGEASPVADLGLTETHDPEAADLLLIVSRDQAMTQDDYTLILRRFHANGGRCLCLNPDLQMLTPNGLQFSAGTIAKLYETLGGQVAWYGKPHPKIYHAALELIPGIPRNRVLCIGDSIHHDIVGGINAGLATALVRTGVHSDVSDKGVAEILSDQGVRPDHILRSFAMK